MTATRLTDAQAAAIGLLALGEASDAVIGQLAATAEPTEVGFLGELLRLDRNDTPAFTAQSGRLGEAIGAALDAYLSVDRNDRSRRLRESAQRFEAVADDALDSGQARLATEIALMAVTALGRDHPAQISALLTRVRAGVGPELDQRDRRRLDLAAVELTAEQDRLRAIDNALALCLSSAPLDLVTAQAASIAGRLLHLLGQYSAARRIVERGLTTIAQIQNQLQSATARAALANRHAQLIDIALAIAVDANEPLDVARWIEHSRRRAERPTTDEELLRHAADRAGPGAWWWTFRFSPSWIYWCLVPPGGSGYEPTAGRVESTPVVRALSDLADHVPIETETERADRVEYGMDTAPLVAGRVWATGRFLGSRPAAEPIVNLRPLLPRDLVTATRAASNDQPLPLVISRTSNVRNIPWSVVAFDGQRLAIDHVRLVMDSGSAPTASMQTLPRAASRAVPTDVPLLVTGPPDGQAPLDLAAHLNVECWEAPSHETFLARIDEAAGRVMIFDGHYGWVGANAPTDVDPTPDRLDQQSGLMLPSEGGGLRPVTSAHVHEALSAPPSGAILVACRSGGRQAAWSGELLGFADGLLRAGTPWIIGTLWPFQIEDALVPAVRDIVCNIVRHLGTLGPAEALRQSQRAVRYQHDTPSHLLTPWVPWVLIGRSAAPSPRPVSGPAGTDS